jgi:hypothetical protein
VNKNEEICAAWAPEGSDWSQWVKPVLFAFMSGPLAPGAEGTEDVATSFPAATGDTCLVIDLPGVQGAEAGLLLARKGYRPVPLYNGCPQPSLRSDPGASRTAGDETVSNSREPEVRPLIDVAPLVSALYHGAGTLAGCRLPDTAPPVFLLDSRRNGKGFRLEVSSFDNRWVTFASDFPSAQFFKGRGIQNVVIVVEGRKPAIDLSLVLREWAAGGLAIRSQNAGLPWNPVLMRVPGPSRLLSFWLRFTAGLGLKRNSDGSFGGILRGSSG